jgi:hypothetical protein
MVRGNKNRPRLTGDVKKLEGIRHKGRCFEPESDSGLMDDATRLIVWIIRRILENGMDMVRLQESQKYGL